MSPFIHRHCGLVLIGNEAIAGVAYLRVFEGNEHQAQVMVLQHVVVNSYCSEE